MPIMTFLLKWTLSRNLKLIKIKIAKNKKGANKSIWELTFSSLRNVSLAMELETRNKFILRQKDYFTHTKFTNKYIY